MEYIPINKRTVNQLNHKILQMISYGMTDICMLIMHTCWSKWKKKDSKTINVHISSKNTIFYSELGQTLDLITIPSKVWQIEAKWQFSDNTYDPDTTPMEFRKEIPRMKKNPPVCSLNLGSWLGYITIKIDTLLATSLLLGLFLSEVME